MSKTHAEIRFEKSRKHLSQVLQNLEEVVKDKIHEAALNSKLINVSENEAQNLNTKIIEQASIIQNLNEEINHLQKNLSELGSEAENLTSENKSLSVKFKKLQQESRKIIDAIEADILKIEEVINRDS